jgi:anti-sigma B factor antagonist
VTGELDLATASTFRAEVRGRDASSRLAIDVSDVSFVDSSGLGVMVTSLDHVKGHGGELAIVTPEGSPVERLLQLTGLDRIVPVARTLTDLSSLG